MPRSRVFTPVVCLIAAVAVIASFFLASRGEASSGTPAAPAAPLDQSARDKIGEAYGKLPISFVANEGQADARVKFMSRGRGYSLYLTATEAVMVLTRGQAKSEAAPKQPAASATSTEPPSTPKSRRVLRMELVGASSDPGVMGLDELPGKVNYLIGDESQWRTNLATFAKVEYREVYPGINLVYYGNQRQLEYDFVLAPGARPEAIRLKLAGSDNLKVNERGDLLIEVAGDVVTMHKPFAYQVGADGQRREVQGRYVLKGEGQVAFEVKGYDKGKTLVVDPVLAYSTEVGSGGGETAFGVAVDAAGSAYVAGSTGSDFFPTTAGTLQPKDNDLIRTDAFVTKLNPAGTGLVYSTYLGGGSYDTAFGIDVDPSGNAHVTGVTQSLNFPTRNPVRGTEGNLLRSTDGGANWGGKKIGAAGDYVSVIAVDPVNPNTVYAGMTWFGPGGIYKSTDGGNTWARVFKNTSGAHCWAIAVHPTTPSTVFAALATNDYPKTGVYKSTDGGATWSKLNAPWEFAAPTALAIDPKTPTTMYAGTESGLYKSTDGGANWAYSSNGINWSGYTAIAVNPLNSSIVYTATSGGVFKSTNGGASWAEANSGLPAIADPILINPTTPSILYVGTPGLGVYRSTNSGASWAAVNTGLPAGTIISSLAMDPAAPATLYAGTPDGRIFKTTNGGASWTKLFETLRKTGFNALAVAPGGASKLYAASFTSTNDSLDDTEAFVSKLNSTGSGLVYSTYLGGDGMETSNSVSVDSSGNAYVAGRTSSSNFPASNAFQPALKGNFDAFVTKFTPAGAVAYSSYLGGPELDEAYSVTVDSTGNAFVTGHTVSEKFPTVNAIPGAAGGVFLTKVSQAGTSVVYSTRLSGEFGYGVAVDAAGSAYVAGNAGHDFKPTAGAFQTAPQGGGDAFVTKVNAAGSAVVYSTFLGGSNNDTARAIALDKANNVYVTGFTLSADYPLMAGAVRNKSPFLKSTNGGASWGNDNYGLKGELINAIALDPKTPSTVFAGTNNRLFKSTDGGNNWRELNTGVPNAEVMEIVVDPLTPSNVYMAVNSFSVGSGVYKSVDGGESWVLVNNGLPIYTRLLSLAIDPVTPTTLYLGTYGGLIYKTVEGGKVWTAVTNPSSLSFAVEIAVSPQNPAVIYAAADMSPRGGIYKSANGGSSWVRVGATQLGEYGRSVAVDPSNPSIVYAVAYPGGLYKSTDGGANWTRLRDLAAGVVVTDPVNPSTVYLLGTEAGLLKSTDGGATWASANKGIRYPAVRALAVNPLKPSTIYLGTQVSPQENDAFVTKLNPAGSALVYSTLLGGRPVDDFYYLNDEGYGIALDAAGNAYVTGVTRSPDFPTTQGAYQPFNLGFDDVFVTKLAASYTIRGQATNADGSPLADVEVTLSGARLSSAVTEGDGTYLFSHLPGGAAFTVTAAKAQHAFTPSKQSFTTLSADATVNFKAAASTAPFYTVSGRVAEGATGIPGVEVKLTGTQTRLATTDPNGNYSFSLPGGGTYTVTPAALGFGLTPASKTFSGLSANQTADFAASRRGFVVTNVKDNGPGSLYQAIIDANETPGPDTITFNIAGPGAKIIYSRVGLPVITDPLVIDATTQPGYSGAPVVEVNGGKSSVSSGLTIRASNCAVRGLAVNSFAQFGILIEDGGNNSIQGNFIGTDIKGNLRRPNGAGGIMINNSSGNAIGGSIRNVISGNDYAGITLNDNCSENKIQGNYIGVNAAGTAALGNGSKGLYLGGTKNLVGGTTPGARNVISTNREGNVDVSGTDHIIQGNFIGTNAAGTAAPIGFTGGAGDGVFLTGTGTLVGGTTPEARNIISATGGNGVGMGYYTTGPVHRVQGNYIGTDVTGAVALPNTYGIFVNGNPGLLVGGTEPGAGNLISGNSSAGISLLGGSECTVQGNLIGTDATGTLALGNGRVGIEVRTNGNQIGGAEPGARNVISGNQTGIEITAKGNVVQGNYIGTDATGAKPLPNSSDGVSVSDARLNTIGGKSVEAGNLIAFNGGRGIWSWAFPNVHQQQPSPPVAGVAISHNRIFSNAGLGIDMYPEGTSPNQQDDTSLDGLQNYPVLTSISTDGVSTTVKGTFSSRPNTTYALDFYTNTACDPSGYGEGARFFNSKSLKTNASGVGNFVLKFPAPLPAGKTITALANGPDGSVSEFSPCDASAATGSVGFANATFRVLENVGNATVTVVRTGGSKGQLTVNYGTSDQTAKSGSDYTAASGTLVFADGETTKTFTVAIANDGVAEPDETARLTLSGLPDVEMLGANPTAELKIQSNNTYVQAYGKALTVAEGDSGTTSAVMTINLTAASGRTTAIDYYTRSVLPNAAQAGTDYQHVSGKIVFGPGVTSQTVSVPIIGDTVDENDEYLDFYIQTSSPGTGVLDVSFPIVIKDDEADPEITIDDARVVEGHSGEKYIYFPVRLSRASAAAVRVGYNIGGGTAEPFQDYSFYSAPGNISFSPGETTAAITVAINGDGSDEPDETFLVSLYNPRDGKIVDGLAVGTIADDDPTAISIGNVTVTEGNSGAASAVFKVSLSGPNAQTVTVNYTTGNGTALHTSDYTAKSGTLSFAPGQLSQNIVVPVTGDMLDESNETFKVQLLSPTNAVVASGGLGTYTIADNDAPPTVSIGNVTVTEANTGAPNATFTITLSAPSGQTVSAFYSTQDGTAQAYSDYSPVGGYVTFSPGQKTRTVTVPVVGDTVDEPNENFKVVLANPLYATLATGTGLCVINDNDAPPAVSVGDALVTEDDTTAVNATFVVSLSAVSEQTVTVKYQTADGTALAASDYTALSLRTLTFAPGQTEQFVTVPVRGDTLDESDETFRLVLSAPVNATLGASQGVCTIADNEQAAESEAAKKAATSTVEFAEAVYVVSEGDGRLEVTVRRAGDLSSPLAVEYATADAG
ncbi:MAG TPA: Calx-beta domain-containing protein, partial [Pyrinomonadaceae bacterium]|nr:Calx-beta domain-containing protein [Pyrinomonadaceae bacterium]